MASNLPRAIVTHRDRLCTEIDTVSARYAIQVMFMESSKTAPFDAVAGGRRSASVICFMRYIGTYLGFNCTPAYETVPIALVS